MNKNTGKIYVGATSTLLRHRFKSHIWRLNKGETSYKLYNSMRKHGVDNFYIEKICDCDSKEEMFEKEKEYIKKYNTLKEGYNMSEGGEDPPSMQGLKRPDHSKWMKENNPMFKKETRENYYKAINSKEWKEKNRETVKKMQSKEARRKRSLSMTGKTILIVRKKQEIRRQKIILLKTQKVTFMKLEILMNFVINIT